MKLRTLIIALVVLAVGGLAVVIALNTHWEEITVPTPLRGEAVTNPFYAAQKLSEALGATTERRQTLGTLTDEVDVLVLASWHWDLIEERQQQIKQWVEAGGRLLVDNTMTGGGDFWDWAGIGWDYPEDEEDEENAQDEDGDRPATEQSAQTDDQFSGFGLPSDLPICGTLEEVDSAGAVVPDGRQLSVCKVDVSSFLEADESIVWGFAHEGKLQAARVEVGNGSVTVLNATPFGNRDLTGSDHGTFFVAATSLRRGDRIAFLSEQEHMSLLGLMWLHGAPAVMLFLALVAALLWRGGVRFGPLAAATETARRSLAEQIRGTGQFAMRLGDGKALHVAAIRALHEAARKRIAHFESLPHDQRIAAIATVSGLDQETLATAINHTGVRRTAELAHTIALLETARRRILE